MKGTFTITICDDDRPQFDPVATFTAPGFGVLKTNAGTVLLIGTDTLANGPQIAKVIDFVVAKPTE